MDPIDRARAALRDEVESAIMVATLVSGKDAPPDPDELVMPAADRLALAVLDETEAIIMARLLHIVGLSTQPAYVAACSRAREELDALRERVAGGEKADVE